MRCLPGGVFDAAALSQRSVQELSSVGVLACHKFDEKSLIAVQAEPLLASKIPLWPHPWMGRNVTSLRGLAACARRSAMTKGTSSSSVPCPMKIGQVTWRILLKLSKRSLMKRRTTDLGTHGSMAWACSGRFVNATRHDQTGHLLAGGEVDGHRGTEVASQRQRSGRDGR